jgi:membrane-associated phospholipid phosphatase
VSSVFLSEVSAFSERMYTRAVGNVRSNWALAFRRHARRKPGPVIAPLVVWEMILVSALGGLVSMVLLDAAVAANRGSYSEVIVRISEVLTRLGKSDWILIPSGVALIALTLVSTGSLSRRAKVRMFRWNVALSYIFIGVGLPSLIATLLKRIIGRPRPHLFSEHGLFDFHPFSTDASFASFPSGHATTIGAMAMVMSLLAPRFRHVFLVIGVLVGFSRVGLGAHHPSDVIVGMLFGASVAYVVAKLFAAHGLLFLDSPGTVRIAVRPAFRLRRYFE